MDMIEIPIVARQVLVVPHELAGLDIDGDGRVAVELGRCGARNGIDVAVALPARPRLGIGDRPVEHLARRVIRTRQPPAARDPSLERRIAPGIAAGLARRRRVVEFPHLLAGPGVMGGDEAARARLAGAAGDHLAVGDDRRRRGLGLVLVVVDLGFPAHLAGLCVERHEEAVVRVVEDQVLEDRDAFRSRPLRPADDVGRLLRDLAPVLPEEIAVGGVDRQHAGARAHHVHDALGDDRRRFRGAGPESARPCHLELADIAAIDLVERAEALLVVGSIEHQPVARRRIDQHVARHRLKAVGLRGRLRCKHANSRRHDRGRSPDHKSLPLILCGPVSPMETASPGMKLDQRRIALTSWPRAVRPTFRCRAAAAEQWKDFDDGGRFRW